MFHKSHKFVQKLKTDLNNIDMTQDKNKIKVWKYIWQKPNFGKNISSELNKKGTHSYIWLNQHWR